MKTDHEIKDDVLKELEWDPLVKETDIGVQVKDGIVTLLGNLDSYNYAEKYAAKKAAQRVAGVRGVAIDMKIKSPGSFIRHDADIALSARNALEWGMFIPADKIKVMVENGWVTLSGDVNQGYQKTCAEKAVRFLWGVKGITNNITVKPSVSGKEIKTEIESALQRRAHKEIQSITVAVDGNQVTLTGSIPTWAEHKEVIRAAWFTPGVAKVIDKISIG